MQKIKDIIAFLINLNLVDAGQIVSFVDDPRIVPSGKVKSGDRESVLLYRQSYTATINVDRYPHEVHSAELLFAHVATWLLTHDKNRDEIAKPDINVEVLEDNTADIEISIEFEEDVYGVEDPAGSIKLDGKNYRLADPVVDYAETGEVTA